MIIYEPLFGNRKEMLGVRLEADIRKFIDKADIIVANRYDYMLDEADDKVYTPDIFRRD